MSKFSHSIQASSFHFLLALPTKKMYCIIALCIFLFTAQNSFAQIDSTQLRADSTIAKKEKANNKDTAAKKHSPRTATIRSALVPGLGQIYNKKYWKLPIVYGALGFTGYLFFDNLKWYKRCQYAYEVRSNISATQSEIDAIHPDIQVLDAQRVAYYRNQFRQNLDYSAFWFIIMWGLNVMDAAVDGHLQAFDVSDDLTLKLQPMIGGGNAGMALVLTPSNHKRVGAMPR
jgi:Family of unknown function (DUF5683)